MTGMLQEVLLEGGVESGCKGQRSNGDCYSNRGGMFLKCGKALSEARSTHCILGEAHRKEDY